MRRKTKKYTEEQENEILEDMNKKYPQQNSLKNTKIDIKFKNLTQKKFANLIEEKEIVMCSGEAGCGKTFIACAQALKLLKNEEKYKKIYLLKSVTTLKDEEIGFLKGTMEEKMEPFVYSFIHNFEKITSHQIISQLRETKVIEVMPIAYCRGLNFDSAIILIDEAQNLTKDHLKTLITRIGTDCKMVFLGDICQIDRKNKKESGFDWIMKKLSSFEEIGIVHFSDDEIVRNPIIKKILDHLEENNENYFNKTA